MTFINTFLTKLAGAFFARSKTLLAFAGILLLALLVACAPPDADEDEKTYTVGGTIEGHTGTVSLTLTYGGATDTLSIAVGTETFTFAAGLEADQSFSLDITAPEGQTCSSSRTGGTIVDGNITDIQISCVDNAYSISGTVSDAVNNANVTVSLFLSDADNIDTSSATADRTAVPSGDGTFSFAVEKNDFYYEITASSSSPYETCEIDTGNKGQVTADITDIAITCSTLTTYSISGSVSGLESNETVTLTLTPTGGTAENVGVTESVDVTGNDSFSFETSLPKDATYTVTVTSQPGTKGCIATPTGTQTMGEADANFTVSCAVASYKVEGAVSGLDENETITLTLTPTGGTAETEVVTGDADTSRDDSFAFDADIAKDATYTVTAASPPTDKRCTVAPSGMQTMGDGNATITITCIKLYKIYGTVTGHIGNVVFTLYTPENGRFIQREVETVNAGTGTYSLDYKMPSGVFYQMDQDRVNSDQQQTCRFGDNWADGTRAKTGTMPDSDVTVNIVCQANP